MTPSELFIDEGQHVLNPNRRTVTLVVQNISAMSFDALSANAIMALNLGTKKGGFAHDTAEDSISRYDRQHGGDLIWQIGFGYLGCRNEDDTSNAGKFKKNALSPQVKIIEIKLFQGVKLGHGVVLLGPKVTPEIAEARSIAPISLRYVHV